MYFVVSRVQLLDSFLFSVLVFSISGWFSADELVVLISKSICGLFFGEGFPGWHMLALDDALLLPSMTHF